MKRNLSPRIKTFLLALGAFVILAVLLSLGNSTGGVRLLAAESAATAEDRADFLRSCGWEVDITSEEEQTIHIPERFTTVYESYNELQLQQGYNLADYAGEDCLLYSYAVVNYPDPSQTVLAHLYVYKNRIIGGDVHSTNLDGFMIGLK